jgi:hypothetical protein
VGAEETVVPELVEGEKEENVELRPNPRQEMLFTYRWSRWQDPGEPDLLSFAAIN